MRWAEEIATELKITLDFTYDNWFIVDTRLQQLRNGTFTTAAPASLGSTASSQSTPSSSKSSKSLLGVPLSEENKRKVLASYSNLDVSSMWKLDSSGRCLENVMKSFCEKSKFLYRTMKILIKASTRIINSDACSMIGGITIPVVTL